MKAWLGKAVILTPWYWNIAKLVLHGLKDSDHSFRPIPAFRLFSAPRCALPKAAVQA